jgi:hypothetical protein
MDMKETIREEMPGDDTEGNQDVMQDCSLLQKEAQVAHQPARRLSKIKAAAGGLLSEALSYRRSSVAKNSSSNLSSDPPQES